MALDFNFFKIAESFDGMIPLDPNDETTWRNWPAPYFPPYLQKKLTMTGGVIPKGEWTGQPIIKLVWGQSEMSFQKGKMRLTYLDPLNLCKETPRHYIVSSHALERFRIWDQSQRESRGKFNDGGLWIPEAWTISDCTPPLTHYLQENESSLDYQRVDRPPEVIPAGWMYIQDVPEFEWIGCQCWFVVYWWPPELVDTEENWEANRYGVVEVPEAGRDEYCDILGPFPRNGEYRPLFAVRDKVPVRVFAEDRAFDCTYYKYVRPDWGNTARPAIKAWREREDRTIQENSTQFVGRQRITEERKKQDAKKKSFKDNNVSLRSILADRLIPKSTPFVDLSKVRNKHGKGKKINV